MLQLKKKSSKISEKRGRDNSSIVLLEFGFFS